MSGNTRGNSDLLILAEEWQQELDEILWSDLLQLQFYRRVGFPKAKEFVTHSIGVPELHNYQEEGIYTYDAVDQGETRIVVNDPVYAANSFTRLLQEDSDQIAQVVAAIPGLHANTIKEGIITDILALANHQSAGTGNNNILNGAKHRFVATGTSQKMKVEDFAYAAAALRMAKVPTTNLVAIVHPSVGYTMDTLTNIANVSNNPRWEGVIATGLQNQMRFIKNIYGFDIYESTMLPSAVNETIDTVSSGAYGVANVFFSMANPALLPFLYAEKRAPLLETDFDFDHDNTLKIRTSARWGTGLVRDDNLVTILSNGQLG